MRHMTTIAGILLGTALLVIAGCAALDEGYSTHYGLMSPENVEVRENPAAQDYSSDTVGIQDIEDYEETYQKKDIMKHEEATEPAEQ